MRDGEIRRHDRCALVLVTERICAELYEACKDDYVISAEELKQGDPSVFNAIQKETLDAVLEYYGDREPYWLSQLTRMEDPWKKAREDCKIGEKCTAVITKDSMQEYYTMVCYMNEEGAES